MVSVGRVRVRVPVRVRVRVRVRDRVRVRVRVRVSSLPGGCDDAPEEAAAVLHEIRDRRKLRR